MVIRRGRSPCKNASDVSDVLHRGQLRSSSPSDLRALTLPAVPLRAPVPAGSVVGRRGSVGCSPSLTMMWPSLRRAQ